MQQKLKNLISNKRKILIGISLAIISFVVLLFVGFILILGKYNMSFTSVWNGITRSASHLPQHRGRTNVLLLGTGGENHSGGDLTDTIMIVSIDSVNKDIVLLSLPRDLWSIDLQDRVNTAYYYGKEGGDIEGLNKSEEVIGDIIGIPIHYSMLINFSGFTKIIDTLGGIDVEIIQSFTDTQYPISGDPEILCQGKTKPDCLYETITFTKGIEHMDGERALKFVRSRHAEGYTGSDFSRASRQQLVIMALKRKILSLETLTNFNLMDKLITIGAQNNLTDIPLEQTIIIGKSVFLSEQILRSYVLKQEIPEKGVTGILINPPQVEYDGKWVLVPKDEDYTLISNFVSCIMNNSYNCENHNDE